MCTRRGERRFLPHFLRFCALCGRGRLKHPRWLEQNDRVKYFVFPRCHSAFRAAILLKAASFDRIPSWQKLLLHMAQFVMGIIRMSVLPFGRHGVAKRGEKGLSLKTSNIRRKFPADVARGRMPEYARRARPDVRTVTTKRPVMPGQRAFLIPLLWRGPVFCLPGG